MGTLCSPLACIVLLTCLVTTSTVKEKRFKSEDWQYCSTQANEEFKKFEGIEELLDSKGGVLQSDWLTAVGRHQRLDGSDKGIIPFELLWYKLRACGKALKERTGFDVDDDEYDYPDDDVSPAAQLVGECHKLFSKFDCDESSPYRTVNGSCNNLKNPTWGTANSCQTRLIRAVYDDGVDDPRTSVCGNGPLPNPRSLSLFIHKDLDRLASHATVMVMQWGQFSDHDLTLTPSTQTGAGLRLNCCPDNGTVDPHPQCMSIPIPEEDTFFTSMNKKCMNFVRSAPCLSACTVGPRNPMNSLTHYIDGSMIYGSQSNETKNLRSFKGGRLRVDPDIKGGEFLPRDNKTGQCANATKDQRCFIAGDGRVNVQPGLTSLHVIWLRQHNRIAQQLAIACRKQGRECSDELLFQEARRIVAAQIQRIHYEEFLRVVLGTSYLREFRLTNSDCMDKDDYAEKKVCLRKIKRNCARTEYDPDVNPSTRVEFSTAAYRFGHSIIPNKFFQYGQGSNKAIYLRENFFNTDMILNGSWIQMVNGMCSNATQDFDPYVVEAVTKHLYKRTGAPSGLDLVALNLQRGRDHGLAPYVKYLQQWSGQGIPDFQTLQSMKGIRESCRMNLPKIYNCVDDIDLFTGGLCEEPVEGGLVGPTFAYIIAEQMKALIYGDRFFYTHRSGNGVKPFTDEQLCELMKTNFAEIICKNTGLHEIPENVFINSSSVQKCEDLPELDFSVFVRKPVLRYTPGVSAGGHDSKDPHETLGARLKALLSQRSLKRRT